MTSNTVTRLSAGSVAGVASIEGTDPTMFFPASSGYTSASLTIGDTAYVYGECQLACHLARVPLASIADRTAWRFFAGRDGAGVDQWSTDPARAVGTIAPGAAGETVLWSPALHGFLNLFMPYGSSTLRFQIGGSPFGPWSTAHDVLATATGGSGTNYAAYGHTEFAEGDGLVQYVSYFQPSSGAQRLVKVSFSG